MVCTIEYQSQTLVGAVAKFRSAIVNIYIQRRESAEYSCCTRACRIFTQQSIMQGEM